MGPMTANIAHVQPLKVYRMQSRISMNAKIRNAREYCRVMSISTDPLSSLTVTLRPSGIITT